MPEIEFKNVSKRFGRIVGLEDVSLKISDNEYVALLGPSGCGKTTLLKTLAGIYPPSEGSVLISRRDVTSLPPEERRIGMVFQDYALFPHMNVLDNTIYGPLVRGEEREKAVATAHEMLELVRLAARYDALPRELSGGMQQRLAVARALTTGSKVLLLDEPLSALDAKIRKELRFEMRRMVKELGLTAIHVTHDQEEAMSIADKIVVMRRGKVEQVGAPQEVYCCPKNLFVAGFIGEANFLVARVYAKGDGNFLSILGKKIKAGKPPGKYVAVIRPERLKLSAGRGWKVRNVRMVGGFNRHELERNGESLVALSLKGFKGEAAVDFSPEDVMLFEYPEEGLAKALEV